MDLHSTGDHECSSLSVQVNKLMILAGRLHETGDTIIARELEDLAENIRQAQCDLPIAEMDSTDRSHGHEVDHVGEFIRYLDQAAEQAKR